MKIKILFATLLTLASIVLAILAEEDDYSPAQRSVQLGARKANSYQFNNLGSWKWFFEPRSPMQLRQKSILVIDDDAGMLRALEKVLSGEGATVATADRVPEAIEYLRRARLKTDLVLTDLRMPGKGGTAVLESVLAIAPQTPVIVITAFGNSKIRADCLARGAVKVLEKPVNTQQLLTAITSAFDHLSLRFVAAARITNRPSDAREITQIGGPI